MWRAALVAFLVAALAAPLAFAAPALPEDPAGRRAIRGAPVEPAHESDELRRLREFDDATFPRPMPGELGNGLTNPADGEIGLTNPSGDQVRRASLTGGVGPDAIPDVLRSPERRRSGDDGAAPAIPWLAQLRWPDLPSRLDPRVIRYLEFYKSDPRGRSIMSTWLRKQGRWRALFEDALRRARLPLSLIYVSMIESGYDPHDRSRAGAVGLWQFMPENSKIYGLRVDYWVDERKSPERATEAFTHYIADLKERFGAWPLALAAFNAGYGAVLRSMQKYNTNDYWELCRHEDGLPWETVLYVPKAMAAAIVGENRALFGYDDVPADPPWRYDLVTVPTSMSFAALAKAAGTSPSEIEALNPELRRKRTPPEVWQARVPRGAGVRFQSGYLAHKELVKPFVVRFGERLDDVAREYGVSPRELRTLNGIDDTSEVRPGLTLLVPDGRKPLPPPPCETVIVAVPDKDAVVAGRKRVFYRTLPTDTIADIASFFRVRPVELASWNHLDLDARLASSMVLQLWVAPDFDTSKAALVDPAIVRVVTTGSDEFFDLVEAKHGRVRLTYVVRKGDDLKKIGRKFGLKPADLERINRFGANRAPIVVGQKITVYRAMTAAEKAKAACKLTPGGLAPETLPIASPTSKEPKKDPLSETNKDPALGQPKKEPALGDAKTEPPRERVADPDLDDGDEPRPDDDTVTPRRALPRPPPIDDSRP